MIADLKIDGIDISAIYKAYVGEDGLKGLFAYPPLKEPVTIDYAEMDGVSVDYSTLNLDTRNFVLKLILTDSTKGQLLYSFLTASGTNTLHTLTLPNLGYSKSLRLAGCSDLQYVNVFSKMDLVFADDNPLSGYTYSPPINTLVSGSPYAWIVAGQNANKYGIDFLEGSLSELMKLHPLKETQKMNSRFLSGQTTYTGIAKCQPLEKKFKMILRAYTADEFWHNYYAFLYDITKPQALTLSCGAKSITGYYKSSSVELLNFDGRIWCIFELIINAITTT